MTDTTMTAAPGADTIITPTRIYRYEDHEWTITDPAFTHEMALQQLGQVFPALAENPEVKQEVRDDGAVVYTLRKRAGRKG